ncbi:unnamed protein product, partial [Didymodactylos carnosus]
NIQKEKFLIIWTVIDNEIKQTQLADFWKNVSPSLLHEHRLKCSMMSAHASMKQSVSQLDILTSTNQSQENSDMQRTLNDALTVQKTLLIQTSKDLKQIRGLLIVIFVLLLFLLVWDVYKSTFASSSFITPSVSTSI